MYLSAKHGCHHMAPLVKALALEHLSSEAVLYTREEDGSDWQRFPAGTAAQGWLGTMGALLRWEMLGMTRASESVSEETLPRFGALEPGLNSLSSPGCPRVCPHFMITI